MAQNNREFNAKECPAVIKFLFLKGNSTKKIYDNMPVTLGDKLPSYSTVKNWVGGFRTGHLSTEDKERSGKPTQVTIPENVDGIYSMLLADQRISAKNIAETLVIL
jgi:transposase